MGRKNTGGSIKNIARGGGVRGFILYHFFLCQTINTRQFILTQCFHIFLLFSIGGARMTKDRAKFSVGPDINMEALLQYEISYFCFTLWFVSEFQTQYLCTSFLCRKRKSWSRQYISCLLWPELLGAMGNMTYCGWGLPVPRVTKSSALSASQLCGSLWFTSKPDRSNTSRKPGNPAKLCLTTIVYAYSGTRGCMEKG